MRIFDNLFFSGNLTRRKPHRETALFGHPLTKVGLLRLTSTEGSYPDIHAEITITSISVPLDGSRRARQAEFRQRLGTLLHEMVHAYSIITALVVIAVTDSVELAVRGSNA
jgi:hypothetical protein